VDLKRLRLGEWIAAAGGVGLFVSLFVSWYGASIDVGDTGFEIRAGIDAWQSFDVLDIVLVLVAALAVGLAVLQATQRSPTLPVGAGVLTTLAGALATLLVAYRIANQPGPNEFIEVRGGAWLGLIAAVAITLGGWESMRNEHVRGLPEGPEPELRRAPDRN
jgi:hypothetical protein